MGYIPDDSVIETALPTTLHRVGILRPLIQDWADHLVVMADELRRVIANRALFAKLEPGPFTKWREWCGSLGVFTDVLHWGSEDQRSRREGEEEGGINVGIAHYVVIFNEIFW